MIYETSWVAITLFLAFVGFVLGLSYYYAAKAKSASGYFAAGGNIHWFVNGIAFAGDYLSAASFLGICGMIATKGFDGFLYSIGYLAGWVVALFVVAEPMKRLGKYTFTDALDSKFNSKGIQLMAAISTLLVSTFYLIPQMVGAGVLVTPLLGLDHWVGVTMVGAIVVFIVATAGMTSTTYVQFLKGGLLIIFSAVLSIYLFKNGFTITPENDGQPYHEFQELEADNPQAAGYEFISTVNVGGMTFHKLAKDEMITLGAKKESKKIHSWWKLEDGKLKETLSKTQIADKTFLYNGAVKEAGRFFQVGHIHRLPDGVEEGKSVGPFEFLSIIEKSDVTLFPKTSFDDGENKVTIWYQDVVPGKNIMKPGRKFLVPKDGETSFMEKLNFMSLMLALFCGTASLPHILIRYYTVPSQKDARKSTIIAIASIGFFYILTLFMGLGAMTSGVMDPESGNMAAPLLAKGMNIILFSIISAIAFATVLGTVSGLIVAASGAVAHDLMSNYMGIELGDKGKVKAGKIAAVVVGVVAIVLGILFKGLNVSFLVGWAFAVAASANLPAIIMLLFWKKTTAKGIAASILVGMISSLGIILVSPSMYDKYGLDKAAAPFGLDNPGIVSIPLAFIVLIVVSLRTQKDNQGLQDINDVG
ncbi:MAG: cation acetate symporter [Opitutae bacterium]|nr:cation acetate symporter [Opitutae bacterium]MBT5692300.1 cation acetate symporter [Opitutae bacterium]